MFIEKIIENSSSYLNSIKIKSLILHYINNLESRNLSTFKDTEKCQNSNLVIKLLLNKITPLLDFEKLQNVFETKFLYDNEFKEFFIFLNYLSENNFVEIFLLFIISSLKSEMSEHNKFKLQIFSKTKAFSASDIKNGNESNLHNRKTRILKRGKSCDFNYHKFEEKCLDKEINEIKYIKNFKKEFEINETEIFQKVLLIEISNFRYYLGLN